LVHSGLRQAIHPTDLWVHGLISRYGGTIVNAEKSR